MRSVVVWFLMTLILSCTKNKNCYLSQQIIGNGEIVSNALVSQPLITWDMKNQEHIIQADTQNVFELKVSFDNGNTFDDIDFKQYTLLGKYARENCKATFERNVSKDDSQKKIFYNLKIKQCGKCETNWESMNWVLVPKIPENYNVIFNIE